MKLWCINRVLTYTALAVSLVPACVGAQPTEMSSCLEEGSYCTEAIPDTLNTFGDDCGVTFRVVVGRLAFPSLVNRGPVVISVRTYARPGNLYPLYVEAAQRGVPLPSCTTRLSGNLVMAAEGVPKQCGGVWETVGPLDLTESGIPLGAEYHVQLVGFHDPRTQTGTTGVACVSVSTPPNNVMRVPWHTVRVLYR